MLEALVLRDRQAMRDFVGQELRGLDESEARTDLLRNTLRAYFKAGQSAASAATAIHVHECTVAYRLRSIEQRLGVSINARRDEIAVASRLADILAAIEVPAGRPGASWGFEEFARRRGDYAIGGAAVQVQRSQDGTGATVRAGLIAAGPAPCLAPGLTEALGGRAVDEAAIRDAVDLVVGQLSPGENVHGTSEYRREVIGEMLRRALAAAFEGGGIG